MALQSRIDNSTVPFIRNGYSFCRHDGIIAQDVARTTPLLSKTVMGKIGNTDFWTPWVNTAALDGSAIPRAIYLGPDIAAADLVDGDVTGALIMVGGCCEVDGSQLVYDDDILNGFSLIGAGTTFEMSGLSAMNMSGIFVDTTEDISEFEN
jgi:hypothetical protein